MKSRLDSALSAWLTWAATACWRRAGAIVATTLVLTLALGGYAATRLGVNTDHKKLLAPDLPFQRSAAAFARHFSNLDDALLIVVDGDTPEQAREATVALADRLRGEHARFRDVYVPGAGSFFEREGLLYRSPEEIDEMTDHLARMQPVLAELSRDGSIANLARLVRAGLDQARQSGQGLEQWPGVLDQIGNATVQVFQDYPVAMSWESLMLQGSALDVAKRQVIITEPVLEFDQLLPAKAAIAAVRAAASELGLTPERGVRVRLTGNPALNQEEMFELGWDVGVSSAYTFVIVVLLLLLAFRSGRLVFAAAATLVVGLIWTAAFATAAVGHLNLVSVAFGVLFIGLGIEFSIHIGMHFVERVRRGATGEEALAGAVGYAASSLVICAISTAIGFLAFVPTALRGVAELGLITGVGMLIILLQSFTVFPALVALAFRDPGRLARLKPAFGVRLTPPGVVRRHPRTVVAAGLVLGAVSLVLLPRLRFESNVVKMRNPSSESVQAFNDLLAQSESSPWAIDALAPDLPGAIALAERMRALPMVAKAVTVADWVPADQDAKRATLRDAAMLLDTPRATGGKPEPMPVAAQVAALSELRHVLDAPWLRDHPSPLAASARLLRDRLGTFLDRIAAGQHPEEGLAELQTLLLGSLPRQLDRLRLALDPLPVRVEDIPPDLKRRLVAVDGSVRVQISPRDNLADDAALARFVDGVRAVDPAATGVAVNLLEFGRVTVRALKEAVGIAFLATALLMVIVWGRGRDAVLGTAPLALATVLVGGLMVAIGLPFNFTNSIVLPLVLGIGADTSTHLVERSRHDLTGVGGVLDTTPARAVFYSAATTIASFGTLAYSAHRGLASMGQLLTLAMAMSFLCNIVWLPALIELAPTDHVDDPADAFPQPDDERDRASITPPG